MMFKTVQIYMSKFHRLIITTDITQSLHLHCSCECLYACDAQTRDFDLSNEKPCVAPSAIVVDADSGRVVDTSCEETWCHKARHRRLSIRASYRQMKALIKLIKRTRTSVHIINVDNCTRTHTHMHTHTHTLTHAHAHAHAHAHTDTRTCTDKYAQHKLL